MAACCVFDMPVEIRFESLFFEPSVEREARLTRERDQARREKDDLRKTLFAAIDICNGAGLVNAADIHQQTNVNDKIKLLRQFAEMAELGESELRSEVESLRHELADAYSALASHTDRLAALAV